MSRQRLMEDKLNKTKTRQAVQEALEEVQHAARPHAKRGLGEKLSWLVALAAGTAVAWRSFLAGREARPGGDNAVIEGDAEQLRHTVSTAAAPAGTIGTEPPSPARDGKTDTAKAEESEKAKEGEAEKVDNSPMALVKELIARFNRNEGMTRAAALAFAGVFSLVPILLFAIGMLGFVIRDPIQAASYVRQFIVQMLPGAQASAAANEIIDKMGIVKSAQGLMHGKWWSVLLGLVSLFISALGLVVTAMGPMNAAWEVQEKRNFLKVRLIGMGVFLGAGALFLLSLLPTSGPDFVQHLHIPWLGLPKHPPLPLAFLMQTVFLLVAVAIDICMFVLLYRYLPNAKVTWKAAFAGGVVAGVLWEVFKKAFAVYLAHFGNFNKLYGALGGAVLLVTWIYYSCIVLIGGAIVSKMYQEHKEEGGVKRKASDGSQVKSTGERSWQR